MAQGDAPPRIFVLRYRSLLGRKRVAEMWLKVPYSGLFGLVEVLARAITTRQVMWFRLDVPQVVPNERRSELARWPVALHESSAITGVDWDA
jgi:hypothetical protein